MYRFGSRFSLFRGRDTPCNALKKSVERPGRKRPSFEVSLQSVELVMSARVEFVTVASSATHGQAEKNPRGHFNAVHHVLHTVVFRYRVPLEVDPVVPVETGHHQLVDGGGGWLDREQNW